jgi:L-amino acid N-acyltransferase YncA
VKAPPTLGVRIADPELDAAAVAAIYRPVVESTVISFEERAPDPAGMADRMRRVLAWVPWLVAEEEGTVIGYAYAAQHRERAGYRWSVDISAYVAEGKRGHGVGTRLYQELLAYLRRQQLVNVYAGVALPNSASVALHESIGMQRVAVYERVGFKFGAWHDVAWYWLRLADPTGTPPEPIALPDLAGSLP